MLFSVTVGLAALMGVVVREAAKSAIPIPKYIIALLGFFVGSTVWSCYFAYVCRLRALRLASYSIYPPSHVEELITTLGSLVAVSGALAMLIFYTCYQSGLMKEGTK